MIRIESLPTSIRALPFNERKKAMQELVDAALHARSICPISQAWAGNRGHTVGVWRSGGRWNVEVEFHSQDKPGDFFTGAERDRQLEEIAIDAIEEAG